MAKGVIEFCKNLTTLIGPVLASKEKENKRLKRLLQDWLLSNSKKIEDGEDQSESENEALVSLNCGSWKRARN